MLLLALGMLAVPTSSAVQRTSPSYSITADVADAGGKRTTSAAYTNDGSAGGVAVVTSNANAPVTTAKHGYLGQLYEVTALQVTASLVTVNEGAMRQLSGAQLLDDLTTLAVPPASITWSIQSGQLTSVSSSGLVTAGLVYQNSAASVQGVYLGNTGVLGLTVLDTVPDNYGAYAADGVGDAWQVQYFGLSNPNAGPLLDLDNDGIPNLLEYALNLSPTLSSTLPVSTFKNGSVLEYFYTRSKNAVTSGKLFQVEWSDTLGTLSWVSGGVIEQVLSDNGTEQQVKATLPAGTNGGRFLRLRVE